MNFLSRIRQWLPFSGRCRKHEWVVLGVLQEWEGSVGDGPLGPSFHRLAAKCANCPQATPNLFRWVDGKDHGDDEYWYGTPLGQPIGVGIDYGTMKVQPYTDADLPRKPDGEATWEGIMDT